MTLTTFMGLMVQQFFAKYYICPINHIHKVFILNSDQKPAVIQIVIDISQQMLIILLLEVAIVWTYENMYKSNKKISSINFKNYLSSTLKVSGKIKFVRIQYDGLIGH